MTKETHTIFLEGLRSDSIYRRPQIKNCKNKTFRTHFGKNNENKISSDEACYVTILFHLRSLFIAVYYLAVLLLFVYNYYF